MSDRLAHPPLPEPAAHMFPDDLRRFANVETQDYAFSVPCRNSTLGATVPLFTAEQMHAYRDASAWLPIETAVKSSKSRLIWVPENKCSFMVLWQSIAHTDYETPGWAIFGGGWREYLQRATLWQPLPAPPIEQTEEMA